MHAVTMPQTTIEKITAKVKESVSVPVRVGHAFNAGLAARRRVVNPNKKVYNRKRGGKYDPA